MALAVALCGYLAIILVVAGIAFVGDYRERRRARRQAVIRRMLGEPDPEDDPS